MFLDPSGGRQRVDPMGPSQEDRQVQTREC